MSLKIGQICDNFEKQLPKIAPIFYQVVSSICFSLIFMIIKLITEIPASQILCFVSIITLVLNSVITNSLSLELYTDNQTTLQKLILRGFLGGFGGMVLFQGIKLLPLAEGIVLIRTSPLWTAIIATFFLKKEKFRYSVFSDIFLCILGVIFITRPPFLLSMLGMEASSQIEYQYHTVGVILCLIEALASSGVQLAISSLGEVSLFVIIQYFSFFAIMVPAIQQLYSPFLEVKTPNINEAVLLILIAIIGWVAQLSMNKSFLIGELNQMALWSQTQVIFTFLIDIFYMKEELNILSVSGTLMVMCGLILSILRSDKKK